ncbi:MAG: primosomal protein N' [Lachnospiraceae bacterium]|nr:primosomal protein N' [Lachnospiraceae bacterium]
MGKYANIIINIAHESVDKTFQYKIPDRLREELKLGQEVIIPFGRGNKSRKGYVIEITDRAEYDVNKLKELTEIVQNSVAIEGQLIELAGWIRETYGATMIQALKTVLPVKDKTKELNERRFCLAVSPAETEEKLEEYRRKKHVAKVRLMEHMFKNPVVKASVVGKELQVSSSTIQALLKEGVITEETSQIYRNPIVDQGEINNQRSPGQSDMEVSEEYTLTNLQQNIVDQVHAVFYNRSKRPFLLHGITGSGKTEVYVELAALAASEGKASIVLIPEIALTKQTVMRFYKRFGSRVSIIHSRLSKGERYDQFERAKKGEIDVMIGPRSALFTPFSNLGYIMIDEEHEQSYKSENVPKYHARETAIQRSVMTGATVLLASATPSVDSYYRALHGQYELLSMQERISKSGLAHAEIVDLRTELKEGNRSIFSRRLHDLIEDRLRKKQQTLLFLNRRGYHGFISCRSCGQAVTCPNCDVTLSLHSRGNASSSGAADRNGIMRCHYCGYEQKQVVECPSCGSQYIGGFRVGTEQVEELVKKTFPGAGVLRMDMDTTRKKHGHEQIVTAFQNQEADILIGTQMIVKGHDFPNVTLVGILAADMSLHAGDFRSSERTFQLLTQAAGRAGRGNVAGEVVIQTYNPGHYSIRLAKEQNYQAFYEEEITFRSIMDYPPAGHVMEIFLSADEEEKAVKEIRHISALLQQFFRQLEQDNRVRLVGPAPASISRLNNRYRQVIYVKSGDQKILGSCRRWLEDMYVMTDEIQLQFDMSI